MSSKAKSASIIPAEEKKTGTSDALPALTRLLLNATSGMHAVEQVCAYLRAFQRCIGLVLEVQEGAAACLTPFGDAETLTGQSVPVSSHDPLTQIAKSFAPGLQIPGRITYYFENAASSADEALDELLELITQQLGLRLSNERLRRCYEQAETSVKRRIREVTALYDIGQALPANGLQSLLQRIVEQTAQLMEAQACSLLLVDEEQGRLRMAASQGLPPDATAHTQLLSEGIAGLVAQTREPLLIAASKPQDPRLEGLLLRPDIGSAMLVPLTDSSGRSVGVLSIRRRPKKPEFTEEDVRLFSVFATQAALTLVNARLMEDLNRRAGELLKLSTLSRALLSTIDLDTLLSSAIGDVCSVGGFDRCCLFLRDNNRPLFVPRLLRGYPESLGRNPVKLGEGAVGMTARNKTMLVFDSQDQVGAEEAQSTLYRQMKGFARSLGAKAFVAIPILTSKDTCIGVLVADNQRKRLPITPDQKNLLQAFVSQAGIAIENALLYEQMQERVAELRRLKDYTDNVLQSIEAAILTTDTRGQIVRCNRAAEQMLHCSARDLRETSLREALGNFQLPEAEQTRLLDLIRGVQETGEIVHRLKMTLHPRQRPPLTLYVMVSRLPEHRAASGNGSKRERDGVVIIFEDVTQEMRLEAELEKMRRLADIGQLAAKMAHEVRNALSPIKGAAQILRSEMQEAGNRVQGGRPQSGLGNSGGEEETESGNRDGVHTVDRGKGKRGADSSSIVPPFTVSLEWPDIIIAEVDGLSRLTSEMLEFARPTSLDLHPVDVNALLQASVQSLATFLQEHQVRCKWELEPHLPVIMADGIQLGQVIRNLVMNAAQAMVLGGELTVKSAWDAEAEAACMQFRDTGTGIAAHDMERIFQPFVTTRPKGTGLGLPIVQKIVDHHGGRVEVESRAGKGTCFRVYLPLRAREDVGESMRVLPPIIDDHEGRTYPDN